MRSSKPLARRAGATPPGPSIDAEGFLECPVLSRNRICSSRIKYELRMEVLSSGTRLGTDWCRVRKLCYAGTHACHPADTHNSHGGNAHPRPGQ
jgi:hypothetical protein